MAVWLQPGSFTDEILEYAIENWPGAAIGGFADGTVGGEGWCVLVDGRQAMEDAGKLKSKRQVEREGRFATPLLWLTTLPQITEAVGTCGSSIERQVGKNSAMRKPSVPELCVYQ